MPFVPSCGERESLADDPSPASGEGPLAVVLPAVLLAVLLGFMNPDAIAGERAIGPGQSKLEVIAALDSTVPSLMAKARIPGLSVAVIRDGEVAWEKGYGTRNKATGEPVDTRTVFEAACYQKAVDVLPGDTTRNEVSKARLKEVFQKNLARVTGDRKTSHP